MNLASVLVSICLASSVAVSSTPVERQLLAISPHDFAQQFNAVAHDAGEKMTLPDFRARPGWHRAKTSEGISVLVHGAHTGYAIEEVIVVCQTAEQCLQTICMTAQAIDSTIDQSLLQRFVAARIADQLGEVALVISGLVYLVVSPEDEDYVALVIRPYLPQQELTAHTQAALRPAVMPDPGV